MATSVLRRIVRPAVVPEPDSVIASRALRIAMTRAAQNHADLPLSVLGIGEDAGMLDEILKGIGDELMLVGIARRAGNGRDGVPLSDTVSPDGFIGIDLQTRAALIEAQMLGRVLPTVAPARAPTNADLAMAEPLVTGLLAELATTTEGTPLAGWTAGQGIWGRIASLREAGLRLSNERYRVVRLSLDLGAGGRQGLIVIALPLPQAATPADVLVDPVPGWSPRLAANVLGARSDVTAVLHRMSLTLARVGAFKVGDLVLLDGISVASVRVEALDGGLMGTGRLGQMAGMRAVRIEPPPADRLSDAPLHHRGPVGGGRALPLHAGAVLHDGTGSDGTAPARRWSDDADQDSEATPRSGQITQSVGASPEGVGEQRKPIRPFTPPKDTVAEMQETADAAQARGEQDVAAGSPPQPRSTPGSVAGTGPVPSGGLDPGDRPRARIGAIDPGNTPDLRPVDDLPAPAVIRPIMKDMPTGIAISPAVMSRGGLDLADEVDLDRAE